MDSWSKHDTGPWEPISSIHAPSITAAVLSLTCEVGSQMSAHLEKQAWRGLPPAAGVGPETALPPPVSPPTGLTESACGCWGPWESPLSVSNITSGVTHSGHFYKSPPSLECNFRMWTDRALAIMLALTSLMQSQCQWEAFFQQFADKLTKNIPFYKGTGCLVSRITKTNTHTHTHYHACFSLT